MPMERERIKQTLDVAAEIIERRQIASLLPLLAICRMIAAQAEISVAVIGRFKAGKSSLLNDLVGRDLLPVGVIPVTAIVTEMRDGPKERATVHFLDGQSEDIPIATIRSFIAESENPDNVKRVSRLVLELPGLERFRGLRFVDTPGLESALSHNTEETLKWLPHVGLALIAISADHPLSQNDLTLIQTVRRYTPHIAILLTKVDLLNDAERDEVLAFMRERLTRAFGSAPVILPYSVRCGYERLKAEFAEFLRRETLDDFERKRTRALAQKVMTLLGECRSYLTLALSAAETLDSTREELKSEILGGREAADEMRTQMRLLMQHATRATRDTVFARLNAYKTKLEAQLLEALEAEFPHWTRSLSHALGSFNAWLRQTLRRELYEISGSERAALLSFVQKFEKQMFRLRQEFRDRLAEKTMRAYGVPLRTTEVETTLAEPKEPDLHIGKIFDRNWETLSPIIPMSLVKGFVKRHFASKIPYMVEKNLSRLASQWTDSINAALMQIERESERRLDELITTVERLASTESAEAPQIKVDIERIDSSLVQFQIAQAGDDAISLTMVEKDGLSG